MKKWKYLLKIIKKNLILKILKLKKKNFNFEIFKTVSTVIETVKKRILAKMLSKMHVLLLPFFGEKNYEFFSF